MIFDETHYQTNGGFKIVSVTGQVELFIVDVDGNKKRSCSVEDNTDISELYLTIQSWANAYQFMLDNEQPIPNTQGARDKIGTLPTV